MYALLLHSLQGLGWEVNYVGALEIILADSLAGDDEDGEELFELENVVDLIFDAL